MAGTLTIGTLSDGTNSTSSTNAIMGSAKAWVNFNGTNGSIRAAYNVSSVTRSSTGVYVVNFSTAMADTNYSASAMIGFSTAGNFTMPIGPTGSAPTTTTFPVRSCGANGSLYDCDYYQLSFFR